MTTSQTVSTELKKYKCSENAFLPKTVVVPLVQEKNVECKIVVVPGQTVSEGEIIAKAENDENAKIHSPIPGKIIDIVNVLAPNGCYEKAVKIALEGSFNYTGKQLKEKNWKLCSEKTITEKIAEYGIVNTFVTNKPVSLSKQISRLSEKDERALVVRLFDEDRLRLADSLLTKFNYEKIIMGSRITAKAIGAQHIVLVLDSKSEICKKPDNSEEQDLIFHKVNTAKYPSGFKRQIISSFNRTSKKSAGFSLDKGDFFTDSYTMLDVYNGIVNDMPVISHYINFTGNCLPVSTFLNTKIGFTLENIVQQIGGFVSQPAFVIINGQICGNAVNGLDVPVTKYVKSVEFVSKSKLTDEQIYECTDCGNCRAICDVHISPDLLYKYITKGQKISEVQINSATLCTSCNLCNSVCPARLPLSPTISVLKTKITGADNED